MPITYKLGYFIYFFLGWCQRLTEYNNKQLLLICWSDHFSLIKHIFLKMHLTHPCTSIIIKIKALFYYYYYFIYTKVRGWCWWIIDVQAGAQKWSLFASGNLWKWSKISINLRNNSFTIFLIFDFPETKSRIMDNNTCK